MCEEVWCFFSLWPNVLHETVRAFVRECKPASW